MSVTTSTNTVSHNVMRLLADYELHHSEELADERVSADPNAREEELPENPDWWPTDHRRVPNYRPVNRNLDRETRPGGSFVMETVFIFTMLNGVNINAHASRIWRKTGGRLNETIFRYPVGGER